ncbi:hypothetical protein V6N13_050738 [Hibiscus sabdariffa]|uniref:Uncharacterized protein n=1 Tax=Hibiscus sabdariffa TaxID=183260 RepID=A0ABR2PIC1_9ROSI
MGCFLGCFGFPTKNSAKRVLPGDSKIVSHGSLDSSVSQECPIPSNSQLSEKLEERPSIKPRKKVTFNMNVQTCDPVPERKPAYRFMHREEREIYYRYIISRGKIRQDYLL